MNNSNIENNTLTITNKANGTPIVIHNSTYNLIKITLYFQKQYIQCLLIKHQRIIL